MKKLLIFIIFISIILIGAYFYIQNLGNKKAESALNTLTELALENNAELSYKDYKFNIFNQSLTINRLKLKNTNDNTYITFESLLINQKNDLLQKINFKELDKIINLLKKCFKNSNILYTCGNGGSSSLADHFTCDFIKQTNNQTNLKVKSISLASNFSLISAIANDISYEKIFSFQIEKLCKKNDVLFLFSVSGNSPNLVEAIKAAKKIGTKTVSFTGFNGGKLSKISDFNINFLIANFGIAEDIHSSIMHYLSHYLRIIKLKNKNFKKIQSTLVDNFKNLQLSPSVVEELVQSHYKENKKIVSLEGVLLRLAVDNKISREEFLKYYIGNEINPKFESFLIENPTWKSFFKKFKKDFNEIRERLVEFSKKIGLSVGEFKKLVSRIQKEKENQELQRKKWLKPI